MLDDITGNRNYTNLFQMHFSHMIRPKVWEKIIRCINYTN